MPLRSSKNFTFISHWLGQDSKRFRAATAYISRYELYMHTEDATLIMHGQVIIRGRNVSRIINGAQPS